MKLWRVILLLSLFLITNCRKPPPIQPTNIKHQWETLTNSTSFKILGYNYTNVTNNEFWNLLDLREIDSLYIEVNDDEVKLIEVEIVNGYPYYGWEKWKVIKDSNNIYLEKDQYLRYKVISVDEDELNLEGYHTFHQEHSRINIIWVRI